MKSLALLLILSLPLIYGEAISSYKRDITVNYTNQTKEDSFKFILSFKIQKIYAGDILRKVYYLADKTGIKIIILLDEESEVYSLFSSGNPSAINIFITDLKILYPFISH